MYTELIPMKLLGPRGSSSVFRLLARNVYFAGLDVELLERAELLSDILWERDCDKTRDNTVHGFCN